MEHNRVDAAVPWWERRKQQREEFYRQLEPFPHLFKLPGYYDINDNVYRSIKDRLNAERTERGVTTIMERSRDANLIAFASCQLEDYDVALRETESVLKEDSSNPVANANKAILLWHANRKSEAEKQLRCLRDLQKEPGFRDKETEGKAEMAYCYSRMGPRFTHLAIQQLEEVVSMKPGVMDWKLGLAISLRRFSQQDLRMSHGVAIDDARETAQRAAELFKEVKNSDAPDLTKAQAAADLGLMLFNENLDLCKSVHNARELSASQCFEEAKRLAPKDVSTLNKIGTYHAINKDFTEARRCFETSIGIMPTAKAHDQLGAVLQNLAEEERKAKAAQQPPADDVHSSGTSAFRTRLTPDDKYVDEALRHFQKAIDLSHGEDTTAVRNERIYYKKSAKKKKHLAIS